ncbi:hypothetical protein CPC08DRAFT_715083 [Agrocybe pediades]|nr:hypothetical protein CPC08DRAFT_715083 [Agrocybe pediades]
MEKHQQEYIAKPTPMYEGQPRNQPGGVPTYYSPQYYAPQPEMVVVSEQPRGRRGDGLGEDATCLSTCCGCLLGLWAAIVCCPCCCWI